MARAIFWSPPSAIAIFYNFPKCAFSMGLPLLKMEALRLGAKNRGNFCVRFQAIFFLFSFFSFLLFWVAAVTDKSANSQSWKLKQIIYIYTSFATCILFPKADVSGIKQMGDILMSGSFGDAISDFRTTIEVGFLHNLPIISWFLWLVLPLNHCVVNNGFVPKKLADLCLDKTNQRTTTLAWECGERLLCLITSKFVVSAKLREMASIMTSVAFSSAKKRLLGCGRLFLQPQWSPVTGGKKVSWALNLHLWFWFFWFRGCIGVIFCF